MKQRTRNETINQNYIDIIIAIFAENMKTHDTWNEALYICARITWLHTHTHAHTHARTHTECQRQL